MKDSMEDSTKPRKLFSKKSESLNEMIINYYNRFGKGRDIEKYLRFRRHYAGVRQHSSSESSLFSNTSHNRHHYHLSDEPVQTSSKSFGSLEQLLSIKNSSNNSSGPIPSTSGECGDGDSKKKSLNSSTDKEPECDDEEENEIITDRSKIIIENSDYPPAIINITNIKKKNEPNNKKSFSFNCESNIEITIPSFPIHPTAVSMPNLSTESILAITEGSQTDFEEIAKLISSDKLSVLQEVNEEELQTPKKNIKNETTTSISPESNVKSSIHKRLEWDSLGDVGYNTTDKTPTKDKRKSTSISTLERSVLKDFFADRGFALSFPGISSSSTTNDKKILDKSLSQGAIPKKRPIEEKWRKTLASVQQKYYSSPTLLTRQKPVSQSIDDDLSSNNVSSFLKDMSSNRHSTQVESLPIGNLEQFCQTSLVRTECREIQCDFSNGGSIKSAYEIGSMTSQSSFEYYSKTNTSDSNKENEPFKLKKKFPTEDSGRKHSRNSSSQQRKSPRKCIIDIDRKNEVELGIQLLCSLIEAKNLDDRQKKHLIKKIIAKIARKNIDSLNSTTTVTGTSQNSTGSKASSISTPVIIITPNKENINNASKIKEKKNLNNIKENSRDNKAVDKSCITSPSLMDQWKKMSINNEPKSEENLVTNKDTNVKKKNEQKDSKENYIKDSRDILKTNNENPTKIESTRTRRTITETSGDISHTSPEVITMREWLDPLTKSEFAFEKKNKQIKNLNDNDKLKFIDKHKKKHLNWIDKEIKRLENLKEVLRIENESNTTLTSSTKDTSNPEQESNSKMLYGEKRLYDRVASPRYSESTEASYLNSIRSNYISPNSYNAGITPSIPTGVRPDNNRYTPKFSCNCNSITKRNSYLYDEVNPYDEQRKSLLRETTHPNEISSTLRSKLETPISSHHEYDCLLHALRKRKEFIEKYVNQDRPRLRNDLAYAMEKKTELVNKYLNNQEKFEVAETHYSNPKESPPIQQQRPLNLDYPSTSYASSPSMSIRFASGGPADNKRMEENYKQNRFQSGLESSRTRSFLTSTSKNKNPSSEKAGNDFISKGDLSIVTRNTLDYCNSNLDVESKKKSVAYIITFKDEKTREKKNDQKCVEQNKKSSIDIRRSSSSPIPCSISNHSRLSSGSIDKPCNTRQDPTLYNEKSKSQVSLGKGKSKSETSCVSLSEDDQAIVPVKKCVKINCKNKDHKKNSQRSKSQEPIRKNSDARITIEIITRKESYTAPPKPCAEKSSSQICIEPIKPPCTNNVSKRPSAIHVEPIKPPCSNNISKRPSGIHVEPISRSSNDLFKNKSHSSVCKEKSKTEICPEKEMSPCEVENNTSNDFSNICPDECNEPVPPPPVCPKKKKCQQKPKKKKCPCKDKRKCYCKEEDSNICLSLQDHYQQNCPDFYAKAMERQCKLKELQKLRKERAKKMHEIVENNSCTTIFRKLKQLPPPAATQIKIFTSKEKHQMTDRKHRTLPETVEKCAVLRREREKCGNQILRGIFNQRMQKRVRQGKLSLQQSRTII